MIDMALERNRKFAWFKFFAQRSQTEEALIWAAELAQWIDTLRPPCPTCGGKRKAAVDWHVTRPGETPIAVPCPDCVDGNTPHPPALTDLITQVRSRVPPNDLRIVTRYVTFCMSPGVLQSQDG